MRAGVLRSMCLWVSLVFFFLLLSSGNLWEINVKCHAAKLSHDVRSHNHQTRHGEEKLS